MEEGEVGGVREAGAEDAIVDQREVERRREVEELLPGRRGEVAVVDDGHLDRLAHGVVVVGVGGGAFSLRRPVHFHESDSGE